MKQLVLDIARAPEPTLDNFVPGRNAELLAQLKSLCGQNAPERFLYLWGAPGSGRSHLLKAVAGSFAGLGASSAYVACSSDTRFEEGLERLECLAVDDVERLGGPAQIALFNVYNGLRDGRGALLVAGGAPPVDLKLRADLVTRLGWGLVYQLHALTDEEKGQALMRHAAVRGFRLQEEVCDFLLHRVRRDMPSLLATLDALDRYSLETKRPITVPLARELLRADERGGGTPPEPVAGWERSGP